MFETERDRQRERRYGAQKLLHVIMTLHIRGGEEFIDYVCEGRGMSAAVIKTNVLVGITPRINSDIIGHILIMYEDVSKSPRTVLITCKSLVVHEFPARVCCGGVL